MTREYDPNAVQAYYDTLGEQEWNRLVKRPSDEVSFEVHRALLLQHVRDGQRVLEIGAGPGRFTIELARVGARITVGDLSAVQLTLNARQVRAAGCEEAIDAWVQVDAVDLSRFEPQSFDVVVAYGGVLSYLFDRAGDALQEFERVLRPGGSVLLSVMSHLYNIRKRDVIARLQSVMHDVGPDTLTALIEGGAYAGPLADGHEMRLYRHEDLSALLNMHGFEVLTATASNCLSVGNDDLLRDVRADQALWRRFMAWELRCAALPGALDHGHHLVIAGRKSTGDQPGAR